MQAKFIIPAVFVVALVGGCASTTSDVDPVRARVLAEMEQARKDGSFPPSEADYNYPNWAKSAPHAKLSQDASGSTMATGSAGTGAPQ
jgi:hypothetical protein